MGIRNISKSVFFGLVLFLYLISNNNTIAIDPSKFSLNPSIYSDEELIYSIRLYKQEIIRFELEAAYLERGRTVTSKGDAAKGLAAVEGRIRNLKERLAAFEEELAQRVAGTKKYTSKDIKPITSESFELTRRTIRGMSNRLPKTVEVVVEPQAASGRTSLWSKMTGTSRFIAPEGIGWAECSEMFVSRICAAAFIGSVGAEGIRGIGESYEQSGVGSPTDWEKTRGFSGGLLRGLYNSTLGHLEFPTLNYLNQRISDQAMLRTNLSDYKKLLEALTKLNNGQERVEISGLGESFTQGDQSYLKQRLIFLKERIERLVIKIERELPWEQREF